MQTPILGQSSRGRAAESLQSTHEEADTRIILHAIDAISAGYQRLIVQCRDTDVLVLLIHFYDRIAADEIWMSAGTKTKPKFFPVHAIRRELSDEIIYQGSTQSQAATQPAS